MLEQGKDQITSKLNIQMMQDGT